jgi:hypothetical protein
MPRCLVNLLLLAGDPVPFEPPKLPGGTGRTIAAVFDSRSQHPAVVVEAFGPETETSEGARPCEPATTAETGIGYDDSFFLAKGTA